MTVLLLLALALAMDAFAVALCQGATARVGAGGAIRLGAAFGAAQGLMPLLGWGLGVAFAGLIEAVDHWIAFGLLGFLGARMVQAGLSGEEEAPPERLVGSALFVAALATSIDAAAAGVTLPTLDVGIAAACVMIAAVTGLLCTGGAIAGGAVGARLGKRAEVLGGLVLIGIGAKILAEHLAAG